MGGSSSPVKAITKAVQDVANTGFKAVNDVTSGANVDGIVDHALGGTVSDIAGGIGEGAAGIVGGVGEGVAKVGQFGTDIVDVATLGQSKRIAKKSAQNAARDAAAGIAAQEKAKQDQLRVSAANRDASKGSSIILGSKGKKRKGGSVSSGLGLSKGKTGLQS